LVNIAPIIATAVKPTIAKIDNGRRRDI